jgi:hypothetical protein
MEPDSTMKICREERARERKREIERMGGGRER